ncbi:MAG: T9SS type A sorting domain-containing protein, partial [Bacteroidota bacterium]
STTLPNQTTRAWYLDTHFGITTYDAKTVKHSVICVRGNLNSATGIIEKLSNVNSELIYPNPFIATINLKFKNGTEFFELYNSFGQCIFSGFNIETQDFSKLLSGQYVLKISSRSISYIKLLKE